jgi:hypothetical protein
VGGGDSQAANTERYEQAVKTAMQIAMKIADDLLSPHRLQRANDLPHSALNVVNLPKISNCLLLGFQKLSHTVKVCDSDWRLATCALN